MYHVGSLRASFLEGHDVDKEVHGLPLSRAEHPDAMLIQHIYQGHKPAHCTTWHHDSKDLSNRRQCTEC